MKHGGVVLGILGLASSAQADPPAFEARVGFGLRRTYTSNSAVSDETSGLRLAADALAGVRLGSFVVGLHGDVAMPQEFDSVEYTNGGEVLPETTSSIYPVDVGLAAAFETRSGLWLSAWVGATVAFAHAHSPAVMLDNIGSYGEVPEVSWRYSTTSLGFGASIGYDFVRDVGGHIGAVLGLDHQDIGPIPVRDHTGKTGKESGDTSTTSVTLGLQFSF